MPRKPAGTAPERSGLTAPGDSRGSIVDTQISLGMAVDVVPPQRGAASTCCRHNVVRPRRCAARPDVLPRTAALRPRGLWPVGLPLRVNGLAREMVQSDKSVHWVRSTP